MPLHLSSSMRSRVLANNPARKPARVVIFVSLKNVGTAVEPPCSQLLLSKHKQLSQEQHVSQPGKERRKSWGATQKLKRMRGGKRDSVCLRETERTQPGKWESREKKIKRERMPALACDWIGTVPMSFDVMLMVLKGSRGVDYFLISSCGGKTSVCPHENMQW